MNTRRIARMAIVSALYAIFVVALAPISFGPLQLRVANILKVLVLFSPDYAFGIALGVFFGNLPSPFGPLDFVVMPLVDLGVGLLAYRLRKYPIVAVGLQAIVTAIAVSVFPLYLGGGIPIMATLLGIVIAQLITGYGGLVLFRPFSKILTGMNEHD